MPLLKIIQRPSPNFDERVRPIDMLIMHYTGMPTGEEAMARMCDPASKVAAHYTVEEDGRVFALVAEDKRAWHAGVSCWKGEGGVNSRSIGIEIVNPGHEFGYRAFPDAQIESVIALAKDILSRHSIPPEHVLGHSDVAPGRKLDPGELFPWRRLADAGVGTWLELDASIDERSSPEAISAVQQSLREFGYCIEADGAFSEQTRAVLRAYRQHFDPAALGTKR